MVSNENRLSKFFVTAKIFFAAGAQALLPQVQLSLGPSKQLPCQRATLLEWGRSKDFVWAHHPERWSGNPAGWVGSKRVKVKVKELSDLLMAGWIDGQETTG